MRFSAPWDSLFLSPIPQPGRSGTRFANVLDLLTAYLRFRNVRTYLLTNVRDDGGSEDDRRPMSVRIVPVRSSHYTARPKHHTVAESFTFRTALKPNSITLAGSELAPNMFTASSELVRSWFEAEIWPII